MSKSKIVNANGMPMEEESQVAQPPAPKQPETEIPQQEEIKELPEVSCGYVVGIKPNGEFVFEVVGTEPGLVQLLGLHEYAKHRLTVAKDINQQYGVPLLSQQIAQLAQMQKVILNMLTQQTKDTFLKK